MGNQCAMKRMKVLHSELHERLGGIESFIFNVWNDIDKERVQFDFLTTFDHPAFEIELQNTGCNIYKIPKHKNIIAYSRAVKKVLDRGYDIVHIHKNSAADVILLHILKGYPRTKVIVHSHNTLPSVGRTVTILHNFNKAYLYKESDVHLACSSAAGAWMYGNKKFEVIRNGISTNKFLFSEEIRTKLRKEFGIPEDAFVVGHVGRFTEQKNHFFLIDIFIEILKQDTNSYLIMIGQGELKEDVEEYVNKKKVTNVIFAGVRKDINEVMMAMDAFVFPSRWEGLPVVIIEAQASGLEVYLSTNVSKECEVSEGVHWFNNEESSKFISNQIFIKRVSINKRIHRNMRVVANKYDISETSRRLLDIYKTICEEKDT